MPIKVTRVDPLLGIPDSHAPGVLSVETFETWDTVFESLRGRGIDLTAEHEAEFRAHSDTQFQRQETINTGLSLYLSQVRYDVREI